jgi:uncharacterized protein (TIGR02246 family)
MKTLFVCMLGALLAAGANTAAAQANNRDTKAAQEITAALRSTSDGWNTGDLSKYLAAYVPEATEMTGEGPKGGVEHIEQTMRNGFWKTGRPLQVLRYENIEVRMLGKNDALVTGQYILSGNGRPDRKGWFTTVWTKTKKGWRMIHDHS